MASFRFVRFLYNLGFPLVLLGLLPGFLHRMIKRGKYRHKFAQRFGIYSARVMVKLRAHEWVWVHAVSVGEVLIALKLIAEMRLMDPSIHVVLSTTTSTGFALASEKRSEWLEPIYNPVDFLWSVRRAVRLIRPSQLILVEAEVWPNLVHAVHSRGAKVSLVNARLSHRSERRFRRFRWLVRPLFNQLDAICVQEPEDVQRWKLLGVSPERIHQFGSIKFDDSSSSEAQRKDFASLLQACGAEADAPILLGGSTWPGEEKALAECYLQLKKSYPALFFVLVPRHIERTPKIVTELESLGLQIALRSEIEHSPIEKGKPDLLLVNTTGELRDWYKHATVVFIGKSLTATLGQNPAEAISAGKPVVFGPNMENFEILVRSLLREGGAIQIADKTALASALHELLGNSPLREALAAQGLKALSRHRGATHRTASLLATF